MTTSLSTERPRTPCPLSLMSSSHSSLFSNSVVKATAADFHPSDSLHVPSIYRLVSFYLNLPHETVCSAQPVANQKSSADLPLLLNIKELAIRYLNHFSATAASPIQSPGWPTSATATSPSHLSSTSTPVHLHSPAAPADASKFQIGFITPPFWDAKIPVTDHLHAHAYVEPADLMGWWRSVAYSPVAWYAIDDLIAEIR